MAARILSVSHDKSLLRTRHMMLENEGYAVVSSATIQESIQHCREGKFDLLILGHSIPSIDKQRLVNSFHHYCPAPVIALRSHAGEEVVAGADYHIHADPEPLLNLIAEILRGRVKARLWNWYTLLKRNRAAAS
jgi:CheY-like chemotaxis protein